MTFQRVLITGANGLLGQQLVRWMTRFPEYDVLATGLDEEPRYREASCGYTQLDITSPQQIRQIVEDFAPGVIINSAAMTRVDSCEDDRERCWQINVDGVEHLAKTCKATGARLVQVSTDFIFDGQSGPYTEEDRPNPINFYGKSKLAAENIVRQFGLGRWSIVRAAMLYGTGENLKHSNLGLWMVDRLLAGRPFPAFTDQWRCFTYAPDLAVGIERIIRYRKSGVYHLSSPEYLSVYDFVLEMANLFGFDAGMVQPASWADLPHLKALRPPRTGFIILKAETELGFRPRSLREALRHFGEQLDLQPVSSS